MLSSLLNLIAVAGFALSMLLGSNNGSYFCSMFIALSFVPMMCAYAFYAEKASKLAGILAAAFAAMYAAIILLVYFAQLTTVRFGGLTPQAAAILDFQKSGLFFHYDLLGYALMALSTFFAGLTLCAKARADRWLKRLLCIHGIFFFSCLIVPMLGLFQADSPAWIGVALLEFWCVYFCPIGALSFVHFFRKPETV